MVYRKSEKSDDAYRKEERWNCDRCHTAKTITKEIPIPTEKAMLVKLLMSMSEKYELKGTTITVGLGEVRAVFRFPEHDLPKLRAIAENWCDRLHHRKRLAEIGEGWNARRCEDSSKVGTI
jgi:hypothetical protein